MLNVVPNPANQSLANSRDLIKNNFGTIDTTFTVNHVQYNDGSGNGGMHNFIQLPTAVPTGNTLNPPINGPVVALYSRNGTTSTIPELFFQRNNLAANTGYAITECLAASTGWTRLPSGIVMKWGNFPAPHRVFTSYSSFAGPAFNNIFNIQITALSSTGNGTSPIYLSAINSVSQFTVYNASGTDFTAYYFAIGN